MRKKIFGMGFLALALTGLMALCEPALAQRRGGGRMGGGGNCPAWQSGGGQSRGWAYRNQTQAPGTGQVNGQVARSRQRQRLRDGSCVNNPGITTPAPSQSVN